jgi:hypothetical protein
MKALVHVMNLFLITFIIFVLAGVSLYQTSFQRRCVLPQGTPMMRYLGFSGQACSALQLAELGASLCFHVAEHDNVLMLTTRCTRRVSNLLSMLPGVSSSAYTYAEPPWYCGSTNPLSHKDKASDANTHRS